MKKILSLSVVAAGGGKGGSWPPLLSKFSITIFLYLKKNRNFFNYLNSIKCQIMSLLLKVIMIFYSKINIPASIAKISLYKIICFLKNLEAFDQI